MQYHKHIYPDAPKLRGSNVDGLILDNEVVHTVNDETIAGVKTFSSNPILPASNATTDNQMVRKKQVDDNSPVYQIVPDDSVVTNTNAEDIIYDYQDNYLRKKDITYNDVNATIRVKFSLKDDNGAGGTYGRIYKNDVAVGTERNCGNVTWTEYSEDLAFNNGDNVQLYVKYNNSGGGVGGACKDLKICYIKTLIPTSGTINMN